MARRSDLIVHSREPFNAEPRLDDLAANFVTPQQGFYVRSHGDVPFIDATGYRLTVTGRVGRTLSLSMAELRRHFREYTVEAVLQCAGNRRTDMLKVRSVNGTPWGPGAIGNARWTGVSLADVLRAAEADPRETMHVAFSSLDECTVDGKTFFYGASIPMPKAMSPDVLLAYAMNDEPLTREHGFPLRVMTPGFAGARSPKWLAGIEVRDTPSGNPIQSEDYKLLPPDIADPDNIDWSRGVVINDLPVNSAICSPAPHAVMDAGRHALRGYAVASGRAIVRVDVSSDGGRVWTQAELETSKEPRSWTFWSTDVELAPGEHEIVVRAWDEAGQTQPAQSEEMWNIKGYLSAARHRVPVRVTG